MTSVGSQSVAVAQPGVADWYKSVNTPLLITGLALASLVAIFSLGAGAAIFATVVCVTLYGADLAVAVPFMVAMLPFDFHRQVQGQWVYLDFALLGLVLPLARLPLRIPKMIWMFVPYFAFFTLSGAGRSLNPTWFWGYVIRWFIGLILAYAIYSLKDRESVVLALGATLVPLCLYAVYQLLIGSFGSLWEWMFPHRLELPWIPRARSFLSWPNEYGYFCSAVTVMLLALAVRGYRRKLCLLFSAAGIIGLTLSGSRGAMLGLVVASIILVFESKVFVRTLSFVLPIALFLSMFSLFPTQLLDRSEEGVTTVEGRMMAWTGAFMAFAQHPLIGIGSRNLQITMSDFVDEANVAAHNAYLQILAENGVVGFVLFFGPFAYLLWRAWKNRFDRLVLAALLALIVFCIHGLFDNLMIVGEPSCVLLFFCALGFASQVVPAHGSCSTVGSSP
jgi:O-antigen ligase